MSTKTIQKAKYKDIAAISVEGEKFRALFLPANGGKCASITDKKTGREFLSQSPGKKYKKLNYDGDYVSAECSGFDDMFPTIDSYYYDQYPWQGIKVPDHGEVCGLEWNFEIRDESVILATHSPRFGYTLEKTITEKAGALSIDYRVTNNTQFPLDFIYAAHCMVAAEKGGAIILPGVSDGEKMTMSFSGNMKRGGYGTPVVWNGRDPGLVKTPPPGKQDETFKFFFDGKRPEGLCEYRYPDGTAFVMRYSADKLPYLGIWINWYDFHDLCNVAFEPCSGSFDRPDMARKRGQYSVLAPHEVLAWNITFDIRREK